MASAEDALKAFQELGASLDTAVKNVHTPGNHRPRPGEDPKSCLIPMGDKITHDATKFAMLYADTPPSAKDSIDLAKYVEKDVDQFVAWCNAVQSESPVLKREVEEVATAMLSGMQDIVKFLREQKLLKPPSTELVGQVMAGNEKLKKLSKSEAQGVQKEVLRDAAAVKTVLSDVKEMLENSAAHAMADLELEEGATELREETMEDMMNMDMRLSPEETKVAEACVVIVEAVMDVLKAAVRVLAAKPKEGEAEGAAAELPYEDMAQASKVFTRGAEDLGALSCLDQSQCKEAAGRVLAGLQIACEAMEEVAAAREGAAGEHARNARQALDKARGALPAL